LLLCQQPFFKFAYVELTLFRFLSNSGANIL
jgi:hypothetical protein